MTVTSYQSILEIIADSLLLVIGKFNFLAFQIPVIVSKKTDAAININMPTIGKKNDKTIAISLLEYVCNLVVKSIT